MRVFALSDIHVDHPANARWITGISASDYCDDLLILAGDVTDSASLLTRTLASLARRFRKVLFVPGNHELWVMRDAQGGTSFDKFDRVLALAAQCGVTTAPLTCGSLSIVPLFGWYDYSFGKPGQKLSECWIDYRACVWPKGYTAMDVTARFVAMNEPALGIRNERVISFSHFLPRIDLMPASAPPDARMLFPALGTTRLEAQIRRLEPAMHVYGHSHLNRRRSIGGIDYINNAFGYPYESGLAARHLICIHEE